MQMTDLPDRKGHFGPYGGIFVAETLMYALDELRDNYERLRKDPAFVAEFEYELKHYVGGRARCTSRSASPNNAAARRSG